MGEILPGEVICPPWMKPKQIKQLKNPFQTFMKSKKEKNHEASRKFKKRKNERISYLKKLVKKLKIKNTFYKKELNKLRIEIFFLKEEIYVNSII